MRQPTRAARPTRTVSSPDTDFAAARRQAHEGRRKRRGQPDRHGRRDRRRTTRPARPAVETGADTPTGYATSSPSGTDDKAATGGETRHERRRRNASRPARAGLWSGRGGRARRVRRRVLPGARRAAVRRRVGFAVARGPDVVRRPRALARTATGGRLSSTPREIAVTTPAFSGTLGRSSTCWSARDKGVRGSQRFAVTWKLSAACQRIGASTSLRASALTSPRRC